MKLIVLIIVCFFSFNLGTSTYSKYINSTVIYNSCSRVPNLTKVRLIIRYKESSHNYKAIGKLKEIGAYQFMPSTWRSLCKRYYNDILIPTRYNQDAIAKRYILDLHKQGYKPIEIASIWNCGKSKPNNKTTIKYLHHFKRLYNENTSDINKLLKSDY